MPGGTLSTVTQPLTLLEYTPLGELRSSIPVPTVTSGSNFRCTLLYAASYMPEGLPQRSFDGRVVHWPCQDLAPGIAQPNNVTGRVIAILRADGTIDTSTNVATMFRDSTTATQYRTVASFDGNSFYATGSTRSPSSNGLHFIPYGSRSSVQINTIQAANQRFGTLTRVVRALLPLFAK